MKSNTPQLYAVIGIIIGLIIMISTVPISKNIDIVTTVGVEFPYLTGLISNPKITSVDTEITANTLAHLPSLTTAGLVSSDKIKIKIIGGGKEVSKTTSLGTSDEYKIVLPGVHPSTNTITIELYYENERVDSKEVKLS